jgi:uncharacterized membrane protein
MEFAEGQVRGAQGLAAAAAARVAVEACDRRQARFRVTRLVYAGAFAWTVGFSIAVAVEQHLFLLRRYDLGNFTQAVWSTAHGHLLQVTEVGGADVSRLGIHVDPIILFLVPLWWLWANPVMLQVVQVVALAAGALPLFWLARKHLASERDAGLVAAAYLLCPAVGWNAALEFHAVALAVPFLIAAIWFLDEQRMLPFAVTAGLAALCQEQIGFIVAALGLWYAWRYRRLSVGVAIAACGATASAVDFGVIIKHFSDGSPYYGRYAGVGGSFSGIARSAFSHPLLLLSHLFQFADVLGVAFLVVPVAFLCFRSSIMLAAVPQFALLMLSDRVGDLDFSGQTVLPLIPFIYVGTVFALARHRERPRWTAAHVLVVTIGIAAFFGPLNPLGRGLPASDRVAAEQRAVDIVPPTAAVSATSYLGAHLAERRQINVFPVLRGADWVVVDVHDVYLPDMSWLKGRKGIGVGAHDLYAQPKLMQSVLSRLNSSPTWRRVLSSSGVSVFRRVQSAKSP